MAYSLPEWQASQRGDRDRGMKRGAVGRTWTESIFAVLFSRLWLY